MTHTTAADMSLSQQWTVGSVRADNQRQLLVVSRQIVLAILLTRAICDPIFNLSGGGSAEAGIGVGALVNAAAVGIALLLIVLRPAVVSWTVYGLWGPFIALALGSTLYAPEFTPAARTAFAYMTYWAFFAIPFFIFWCEHDLARLVLVLLASSVGPSLYAFVDIGSGLGDISEFRLQSTFSHPNIFAFYLVLQVGLALYVRTSCALKVSPWVRLLATAYIPLLIFFLVLTKTRSAWLGCLLVLGVYAVRIDRRFLAGILLLPLLVVIDPSVGDRVTDVAEETNIEDVKHLDEEHVLNSLVWRQLLWQSAIPEIAARPLLGHGLESFKRSTPNFFELAGEGFDAHNFYMQVAFEIGLIGLLALVWLLAALAWRLAGAFAYDRNGVTILFSILVAYIMESYSDNMGFYLSFNWYFWFLMGSVCAWLETMKRNVGVRAAFPPRQLKRNWRGSALPMNRVYLANGYPKTLTAGAGSSGARGHARSAAYGVQRAVLRERLSHGRNVHLKHDLKRWLG